MVFEKILYNQLNDALQDKLSDVLTSFRKGHKAQQTFLMKVAEWRCPTK